MTPVRLTPVLHRRSHQPARDLPRAPPGFPPVGSSDSDITSSSPGSAGASSYTAGAEITMSSSTRGANPPTQQRRWRTSRCRRFHRHRRRVRQPPAQVNAPARAPRPMAPPSARRGGFRFDARACVSAASCAANSSSSSARLASMRCSRAAALASASPPPAAGADAGVSTTSAAVGCSTARLRHQRVTAIVTLLGLRGGEIGAWAVAGSFPAEFGSGWSATGVTAVTAAPIPHRANSLLVHCGNVVFGLRRGEAERGSGRGLLRWRLNRRLCLLERLRGSSGMLATTSGG